MGGGKLLETGSGQGRAGSRVGVHGHSFFVLSGLKLLVQHLTEQVALDRGSQGPGSWDAPWPQGSHLGSYPIPGCNLSDT